jgi:hypothetical protein
MELAPKAANQLQITSILAAASFALMYHFNALDTWTKLD